MNTTVCDGNTVNISCGVINDPVDVVPNWRIIKRGSNGSVISNMFISGTGFIVNNFKVGDLLWIRDINNRENNRLLVGPVDETYNQSSYQCIFSIFDFVYSTIGMLTVAGEIFYYVCICVFIA